MKPNQTQTTAESKIEEKEKFDTIVEASQHSLYQCKTVFPFDFFPDEIIVDLTKIDVKVGIFFLTSQRLSIPFTTIIGVTGTTDLFFGSIIVETTGFIEPNVEIKFLWKHEALKARRIIAGILACQKQGIDLTKLEPQYVMAKIEEVGRAAVY